MNIDAIEAASALVDQYDSDGNLLMKLCCDITLYMDDAQLLASAEGVLYFYQRALAAIGSEVRFVSAGKSGAFKRAPKRLDDLLVRWFETNGPYKGSHAVKLESGNSAEEVSDRAFYFSYGLGRCCVRLMLPAANCASDAQVLKASLLDMASRIRFSCGHAGFSTNTVMGYYSTSPNGAVAALAGRYLGLDLDTPMYWMDLVAHGIKTVNWLTFIGSSFLAKVVDTQGGVAAFEAALGPGVGFTALPHGVVLQAGPAPRLGDVQAGNSLPEYRQVAAALRALRIPDDKLRRFDGIGGSDNTRRWLDRFAP